jgi:hypothetical protein
MLLISNILYKKNASACSLSELDEKQIMPKNLKGLKFLKTFKGRDSFSIPFGYLFIFIKLRIFISRHKPYMEEIIMQKNMFTCP